MTNSELKREVRKRRVIELRCVGLTQTQICEKLREEGFSTSKRTVWEDLHSATAEEFIEELKRRQLADIALAGEDYEIRLKYRDLLLDKIMPRKVEQKTEGKLQLETLQIGFEADPEIKKLLTEEATRQKTEHDTQRNENPIIAVHSTPGAIEVSRRP